MIWRMIWDIDVIKKERDSVVEPQFAMAALFYINGKKFVLCKCMFVCAVCMHVYMHI